MKKRKRPVMMPHISTNVKAELIIIDHTPGISSDIYRMYYNVEGSRWLESGRVLVGENVPNNLVYQTLQRIRESGR